MIRLFSYYFTPTTGHAWHLAHTSHKNTLAEAMAEINTRRSGVERHYQPITHFDLGPADPGPMKVPA